jgi:hypothetical protein
MLTSSSSRTRKILAIASAGLTVIALASSLLAQRGPGASIVAELKANPAAKSKSQAEAPPPPQAPQVVMPNADKIVLLVRTTLLTLNDALQNGNYTVLRDRGAPAFRDANSAARLGQIFDPRQDRRRFVRGQRHGPAIEPGADPRPEAGHLDVKGYFPTRPAQIYFDVLYQSVGGHWRVVGPSVQPVKAAPKAGSAPDGAATKPR